MDQLSRTKQKIGDLMRQNGAVVGYVFGSYAHGRLTPLSDVDLAVLFDEVSPDRQEALEANLAEDIKQLLGFAKVDVINLNSSTNPLLRHRAAIKGVCVLVTDRLVRLELERRVLQDFEDSKYLRAVQADIMHRQIKNGVFGKPQISLFADKSS